MPRQSLLLFSLLLSRYSISILRCSFLSLRSLIINIQGSALTTEIILKYIMVSFSVENMRWTILICTRMFLSLMNNDLKRDKSMIGLKRKFLFSLFAKKSYKKLHKLCRFREKSDKIFVCAKVFPKIFCSECVSGSRSQLNLYPGPKHW
jgi:hypothetical protein